MLGDRLRPAEPGASEPEDILSSSRGITFDDITIEHGDALQPIVYVSPVFGPLTLTLAGPQGEDDRPLFNDHLWNSGLQLAEFIDDGKDGQGRSWEVVGDRVLELGAGAGLAGIVAAFKGAREVVLTDYVAPEILANISANVQRNVEERRPHASVRIGPVQVKGHKWGVLDTPFAQENEGAFDKILVADCLWMPRQHDPLHRSIAWFLALGGRAWVVNGFHTERKEMRGFWEEGALEEAGLEVETVYERHTDGRVREWVVDRGNEDVNERKRWLVISVLRRRAT